MARRERVSSPFTTAPSQNVAVQQTVPTEIQASAAETSNPVQAALPFVQTGVNLAVDSFKRDLATGVQTEFEPEIAAIKAAAFQTDVGNRIGELSEEDLRSSLIQQLGGVADDPRITEAVGFFNKLADAEAKGKSIRGHTQTLALKEMKRMIAANPLFEGEIRKAATTALGFDPTGKDVTSALATFDKTQAAPKLTEFQKDVRNRISTGLYTTEQDAILAAQQSVKNQNVKEALLGQSLVKELSADKYVELGRAAAAGIFDEAVMLQSTLSTDPQLKNKSSQFMRNFVEQRFLRAEQEFSSLTAGVVSSDVVDRELDNFRKTKENTLTMIDNGAWDTIIKADNTLRQEVALNEAFGIPGIVEAYTLFGDRFLDGYVWASEMANKPGFKTMQTQLDPLAGGKYNLVSLILGINKAHERVETQTKASTPTEVFETAQAVNGVVTGKDTDDTEKANYVDGASKVMPRATLLKQFDTDQHKLSVIQNPKLRKQFEVLYADERVDSTEKIATSMVSINSSAPAGKKPVNLSVNEDGLISMTVSPEAITREALSKTPGSVIGDLRENVKRLNNIISLHKRYSGIVLKPEPDIAEKAISNSSPQDTTED